VYHFLTKFIYLSQPKSSLKYNTLHTTDYSGAFVYKDNWLAYILTPEGRIVIPQPTGGAASGKTLTAASYYYEYQLKDHLGNMRVTFTDKDHNGIPEVQSENHYYPFGMPIAALSYTNNVTTLNTIDYKNEYFYNGKEAEDDFGLGWLDYGWREYDPQIGRFMTQDRFAMKYIRLSPYQYAADNPIKFIDVNGDSVHVSGDQAKQYAKDLNKSSSLSIKYDKKTGFLSAKGTAKTAMDKKIQEAINSKTVNVNIITTKGTTTADGKTFAIGAFGGNKEVNGKVETTQTVNVDQAEKAGELYGVSAGTFLAHETVESYIGGNETPNTPAPTFDANSPGYNNYLNAHNKTVQADPGYPKISISVDPTTGTYYLDKYLNVNGQQVLIQSVPLK
jgi:RHS repeat-associated protein